MTKLLQIKAYATAQFRAVFQAHVPSKERGAFIRAAIVEKLERDCGVILEDDTPEHGYYSREIEAIVEQVDKLTDYGRNDPTE